MSRSIRVSEAAYEALVARAGAERRTITAIVEGLMAAGMVVRPPDAGPPAALSGQDWARRAAILAKLKARAQARQAQAVPDPVELSAGYTWDQSRLTGAAPPLDQPRCPKCRCLVTQHQRGSQGNRCETHPQCRWHPGGAVGNDPEGD